MTAGWQPTDPDPGRHVAWVRRGWEAMSRSAVGVYVTFLSGEGAGGLEAAYGQRLHRLQQLKSRYDPTNVFRLNANIEPASSADVFET